MAYDTNGERPRSSRRQASTGGSSRQYSSGNRPLTPPGGSYHGPRGTRTRPQGSSLRMGNGRGQGGYPVKARSINFQGNRRRILGLEPRTLILIALALVLVILVVVGVSSCVRGCSSDDAGQTSSSDTRVAAGLSDELTQQFTDALNRNDKLAQIAASADQYSDQGLLELALTTPEAIDFVASYPTAEKTAQPYEDTVTQGTAPELFCWDARWGAVDYAGHPFALSGSGPTALSMAYMGLTGKNDRTPADLATLATEREMTSGESGMLASFIEDVAGDLGLSVTAYDPTADQLTTSLDAGTYILMEAKAGTLTDSAHWVLLVGESETGSVTVYDPTSPEVSAHAWSASDLASYTDGLYVVTLADSGGATE